MWTVICSYVMEMKENEKEDECWKRVETNRLKIFFFFAFFFVIHGATIVLLHRLLSSSKCNLMLLLLLPLLLEIFFGAYFFFSLQLLFVSFFLFYIKIPKDQTDHWRCNWMIFPPPHSSSYTHLTLNNKKIEEEMWRCDRRMRRKKERKKIADFKWFENYGWSHRIAMIFSYIWRVWVRERDRIHLPRLFVL